MIHQDNTRERLENLAFSLEYRNLRGVLMKMLMIMSFFFSFKTDLMWDLTLANLLLPPKSH